jgi:hypothetical protein
MLGSSMTFLRRTDEAAEWLAESTATPSASSADAAQEVP